MAYTWTAGDFSALVSESLARGIDPAQVALVFLEESGLDPSNPGPAAADPPVGGLNQMQTPNLPAGVSRSAWLGMSAAAQIPAIFAFWDSLARADAGDTFPGDAGTLLALNFLPASFKASGAIHNAHAVIAARTGAYSADYAANASLDPQKTGTITPATCLLRLTEVAAESSAWPAFVRTLGGYVPSSLSPLAKGAIAVSAGAAGAVLLARLL